MNYQHTLSLLIIALCTGCANQPVIQQRGSLQAVVSQGGTYHLDARRSGLSESNLRNLHDRLQKVGLSPAPAESAKVLVTLSSDLQSTVERQHTGGKNGVAYERRINERRLSLTLAENRHDGKILLEVNAADSKETSAEVQFTAVIASLKI